MFSHHVQVKCRASKRQTDSDHDLSADSDYKADDDAASSSDDGTELEQEESMDEKCEPLDNDNDDDTDEVSRKSYKKRKVAAPAQNSLQMAIKREEDQWRQYWNYQVLIQALRAYGTHAALDDAAVKAVTQSSIMMDLVLAGQALEANCFEVQNTDRIMVMELHAQAIADQIYTEFTKLNLTGKWTTVFRSKDTRAEAFRLSVARLWLRAKFDDYLPPSHPTAANKDEKGTDITILLGFAISCVCTMVHSSTGSQQLLSRMQTSGQNTRNTMRKAEVKNYTDIWTNVSSCVRSPCSVSLCTHSIPSVLFFYHLNSPNTSIPGVTACREVIVLTGLTGNANTE